MAPPLFSYFKAHHRRAGSTPNSPRSTQWQSRSHESNSGLFDPKAGYFHDGRTDQASSLDTPLSPISPLPPTLPPIPRVASQYEPPHRAAHQLSKSDSGPSMDKIIHSIPAESATPLQSLPSKPTPRRPVEHNALKINTELAIDLSRQDWGDGPQFQLEYGDVQERRKQTTGYRHPRMSQYSYRSSTDGRASSGMDPAYTARPMTPPNSHGSTGYLKPSTDVSRRPSTPSSSMSPVQKSISSSTAGPDTSPGSSRSTTRASYYAGPKQPKAKMGYLNPVSLLRRRRTAQNMEGIRIPVMQLPEDYDPRIKGTGVHDFNAPRPRRNYSTNDIQRVESLTVGDASPVDEYRRRSSIPGLLADGDRFGRQRPESAHKPVFTDDFDEDRDEAARASVRRESLADPKFLARVSRQFDLNSDDFGPALQTKWPPQSRAGNIIDERQSKSTTEAASARNSSDRSTVRSSISDETRATSPPSSPPTNYERTESINVDTPLSTAGLPKHLASSTSRGSRFSFQLNSDQTIAQEKALEDRAKQRGSKIPSVHSDDDEDDYDDEGIFDDFDDNGPYEEPIPMTNADEYDATSSLSLAVADEGAWTSESSSQPTIKPPTVESRELLSHSARPVTLASKTSDDLYYDDGLVDDESESGKEPGYDESVIDAVDRELSGQDPLSNLASRISQQDASPSLLPPRIETPSSQPVELCETKQAPSVTQLSSQNLNAWHNALASAATKAEAAGKFQRQPSAATSMSDSDFGWYGQVPAWSEEFQGASGDELANYDDSELEGIDEDTMIAAANAEILASDDAEFYGHEFGFYSASKHRGGEVVNGGYFVSADELNRSMSARNACREPNLTPISEKTEFSTRNSVVSLHRLGSAYSIPGSTISRADALPSPGLRELRANLTAEDQDNMSLSQLMQLRKNTFGGSSSVASPSLSNASPSIHGHSAFPRYMYDYPSPVSPLDDSNYDDMRDYEANYEGRGVGSRPRSAVLTSPTPSNPGLAVPTRDEHQATPMEITPRPFHRANPTTGSPTSKVGGRAHTISPPLPFPPSFQPQAQMKSPNLLQVAPLPPISSTQLQKFSARPPASSASYAERERERASKGSPTAAEALSVAYVLEDGNWYLEKRRKLSGGELVVVGRDPVECGSI